MGNKKKQIVFSFYDESYLSGENGPIERRRNESKRENASRISKKERR